MGKTAREDIENRIYECKFFLEIPEIIPIYMYTHIKYWYNYKSIF